MKPSAVICQLHFAEEARQGTHIAITLHNPIARRFRFIDCTAFTRDDTLRICEFEEFPIFPYSTISHVWKGKPPLDDHDRRGTFSVAGDRSGGDPISIDVLHDACKVSLMWRAEYLWLDRLCILQNSREDKHWQIERMSQIYRNSVVCVVIPGGLCRLVSLGEETSWISRGWTLQEALLPARKQVLYSWEHGELDDGNITWGSQDSRSSFCRIVEPGRSAVTELYRLLRSRFLYPVFKDARGERITQKVFLFGCDPVAISTLMLASTTYEEAAEARRQAVWRSALMRTSSRPVDMVFSIMGLFGVTLNTHNFGPDDRVGATLALARAILQQGGEAEWLVAAFELPPHPRLNSFPAFPRTAEAGNAYLQTRAGEKRLASLFTDISDSWTDQRCIMHATSVDSNGYLQILCRAVLVTGMEHSVEKAGIRRAHANTNPDERFARLLQTEKGTFTCIVHMYADFPDYDPSGTLDSSIGDSRVQSQSPDLQVDERTRAPSTPNARTFVIDMGRFFYYDCITDCVNNWYGRALLVEEHASGKFHRIGWLKYGLKSVVDNKGGDPFADVEPQSLLLGGPEEITDGR
ncbi:hypothetical protein WOLCODRAFT_105553 [Wolfiporia cocos MD-104 SS10]|uniref:Heterokaryon incompatibility domain-containing protein n=1 Tax=Wolfiporia cocos (strain MD-104) TaxID=742152 RepID=A0A2H3JT43_WOLCO|nr:hypothetical protein WOLCODRAFT_105553 [Wolfiporia cocos MD-104 SS10]